MCFSFFAALASFVCFLAFNFPKFAGQKGDRDLEKIGKIASWKGLECGVSKAWLGGEKDVARAKAWSECSVRLQQMPHRVLRGNAKADAAHLFVSSAVFFQNL